MFLYLIIDGPASITDAGKYGLGHIGKVKACREVSTSMGRGTMITSGDVPVSYKPEEQTWRLMPSRFVTGEVWCGYWNDRVPNAEGLAKPHQLDGEMVKLIGGEEWLVPKLRKYLDDDEPKLHYQKLLPTMLDYSDDGELLIGEVAPQYQKVWERALEVGDRLTFGAAEKGTAQMGESEVIEFAGPVLGLNYYVSIFEIVMLGLIGIDEGMTIVRKSLDMDGLEARLKNLLSRQVSSGMNTDSGDSPA